MVNVHILLGGLFGFDGYATSAGMFTLADTLKGLPNMKVWTWTWDNWELAAKKISQTVRPAMDKLAVIGYSGGGSRATYLANSYHMQLPINLMVLYDPSPAWQMQYIGDNVQRAICYQNDKPRMWVPLLGSLGGGRLEAVVKGHPFVEIIHIEQQHLLVQTNTELHKRTVAYVEAMEPHK